MYKYISKEAVVNYLKRYSEKECNSDSPYGMIISSVLDKLEIALSEMTDADVQSLTSDNNCIVCGHDVQKENVYYDVNGATICESCMNTKFKCKNGR